MTWKGWEEYVPVPTNSVHSSTMPKPKRSKYGAEPTVIEGIRFDSKKEAKRYVELRTLELAGQLHGLSVQPRYPLHPWSAHRAMVKSIGEYRADFKYCECAREDGYCTLSRIVVEDVKGFKTPLYRWKKRHVEAEYGIEIREI